MEKQINKDSTACCKARDVLWYLVFTGFAVNYMIRINLNLAIVSMVEKRVKTNESKTSECLAEQNILENATLKNVIQELENETFTDTTFHFKTIQNFSSLSNLVANETIQSNETNGVKDQKFDWDEKEQGSILGSFFWLHWLTQIPGGILASKYGTKTVFGLSNFTGVLCCFAMPWCAIMGANYLIFIRTLQGLLCGFSWPAMHNMTARWIPPNERSKFVTAYLGSSVGAALTYPLCGFIIDKWGWEYAFHVCGVLGCLWFVGWWLLVYDSPAKHPRISQDEKEYIISSLGESYAKKKAPVPWIKILTNKTVNMNIIAQFGGTWGLFSLMTNGPAYFNFIHGMNIKSTGLLSGMPHMLRMVWAFIISQLGDYLLRTNKMSRPNVRKLATAICTGGQGLFMMALAHSGCNSTLAVIFLSCAITMNGAVSTGPLASVVDLSPNYASVILGITNTVVAMVGFATPALAGYLTYNNQTSGQYQKFFWIASAFLFLSGTLYIFFAESILQPWNSPEPEKSKAEAELMVIKTTLNEEDERKKSKNGYEKEKLSYSEMN